MQKRTLGNSDLNITPLGVGAWAMGGGNWAFGWGPQDDADSVAAVHPYQIVRLLGGLFFLAGALIMVWNVTLTARGAAAESRPDGLVPAEA